MLYAYIRSVTPPSGAFAPLYIPLLNIPLSGLRLRPEFTAVCEYANISPSSLITLDDLPDNGSLLESTSWILVDHNKLQGYLGKTYSAYVHGVLDHHEEENAVLQRTEPEPRVIEKCGSCTSLVVRYCRDSWDSISNSSRSSSAAHGQGEAAIDDSVVTQGWDAQVAKMAVASILVDTANLTAPGKIEKVDIEAVDYLEAKIKMSSKYAKSWSRDGYYQEMSEAKKNIGDLTLNEILKKDYKQWAEGGIELGISSVVKCLEFLANKADEGQGGSNIEGELERFMSERKLELFAIMTTSSSEDGQFRRELLLQTNAPRFSSALTWFADRATIAFQLEEMLIADYPTSQTSGIDKAWRRTWLQKDVSKSRKQVAPLLREALKILQSTSSLSSYQDTDVAACSHVASS